MGSTRTLLERRIGAPRLAQDPQAVDEIIGLCARLPLAGDDAGDVRAVLSWTYDTLDAASARLFRLLGSHPGPDIGASAAASLAGLPLETTAGLLDRLCEANFLGRDRADRYAFHDLLRAYATDRSEHDDSDGQRRAALTRALDHYLHTAHTAAVLFEPNRGTVSLPEASPLVLPQPLDDHAQALAWFNAEHAVLLAAAEVAATTGHNTHAWQLAWAMADFLERQGHWHDQLACARTGLAAANRLGDPLIHARAHRLLARAAIALGHFDNAHSHLLQALEPSVEANDLAGQAYTYQNLARVSARQDRHQDALRYARRAHDLFDEAGHLPGLSYMLNAIGWYQIKLGGYAQALASCREALEIHHKLKDRFAEAATWDSIGYAHQHLGEHEQAADHHRTALAIFREIGDRLNEAVTLDHLGDAHHAAGRPGARAAWQQALGILEKLDHADAERVRAKLAR